MFPLFVPIFPVLDEKFPSFARILPEFFFKLLNLKF